MTELKFECGVSLLSFAVPMTTIKMDLFNSDKYPPLNGTLSLELADHNQIFKSIADKIIDGKLDRVTIKLVFKDE